MRSIQHATRVNSWYENLPSEDMPPEWMWPFEDELSTWFEQVEAKRKARYGDPDDSGDGVQNEWDPDTDG